MSPPPHELAGRVLPDTVNGLPLHPLSVHFTVVLVPLAALLGVLFVIPQLRAWSRWPLALVGVGAALSTYVSRETGETFEKSQQFSEPVAKLVERHEELADQLWWMILGYAAVAVVSALVVGRSTERSTPDPEYAARARASVGSGAGSGTGSGAGSGAGATAGSGAGAGAGSGAGSGGGSLGVVGVLLSVVLVLGAGVVGFQTYRVGDSGAKAVWGTTTTG